MKNIEIAKVYIQNQDLGGTEWTPKEINPRILKDLKIDQTVKKFAEKKCDAEKVFVYVTLIKETSNGESEFSISMLSIDKPLDGKDLKEIKEKGLDFTCMMKGPDQPQFLRGYSSAQLYLEEEGESFLLSLANSGQSVR